ncbi:MAG TPA: hypothetical protein DDW50_11840 [Firmicutes bacterium]|nr:hypothetical protein [Bacillota bacterium]
MKKTIKQCSFIMILVLIFSSGIGYSITRAIPVGYLPGASENSWIQKVVAKDASLKAITHPTIALNLFSDEREITDSTGAIYNRSGKKLETLVTDKNPAEILEKTLIEQFQKAGFTVIRTSGWDLSAEKIPGYLEADMIVGGRVKTFWVESKAGFITSTIQSKVVYDLVFADIHQKKIMDEKELVGSDTRKSLAHISDYFWMDIQTSISQSLTRAVNDSF